MVFCVVLRVADPHGRFPGLLCTCGLDVHLHRHGLCVFGKHELWLQISEMPSCKHPNKCTCSVQGIH